MTHAHIITADEFNVARDLAHQTLKIFERRPGYYTNNINSHLRGKLGEIAVSAYLRARGAATDGLWRDLARISEADVVIAGRFRADVKTWDIRHWPDFGRCISVDQFPTLRTKADGIVWCTSDSDLRPGMAVTIQGWNTMDDVAQAPERLTGPTYGRKVHNHQLDAASLREIRAILNMRNE